MGWSTLSVPDNVQRLMIVGGKTPDGAFAYTVIGERDGEPNYVEPGILDVKPEDESHFDNSVPRTDDGVSVALDRLRPD